MTTLSLARRGFLRGRVNTDEMRQTRPPWARTEADFVALCTLCGDCRTACSVGLIVGGEGAFPVVDFSHGECTFCAACVEACKPQALFRSETNPEAPWALKASIGDSCLSLNRVECRVCGEICPTGAIRFRVAIGGIAQPVFDAQSCTGCGGCYAPCPVSAITIDQQETEEEAEETTEYQHVTYGSCS